MHRCLILLCMLGKVTADRNIEVSKSECDWSLELDETGIVFLTYTGVALGSFNTCTAKFKKDFFSEDSVCVEPQTFNLGCSTTVSYYEGIATVGDAEKYTCGKEQTEKWCTSKTNLAIKFSGTENAETSIKLKIYAEETPVEKTDTEVVWNDKEFNDWAENVAETAVTSIYLIIGLIIGGIVLLIVLIIVVVCCCCRRRNTGGGGGVVYRSPEQAVAM